jgi:hypothetical protein
MSPALDIDTARVSNTLQKNYPNFTPLRKFLCLFGLISFILEVIALAPEIGRDRGEEKTTRLVSGHISLLPIRTKSDSISVLLI